VWSARRVLLTWIGLWSLQVSAAPVEGTLLDEVAITADRPMSAASDQEVRNRDFMVFPRRTASDLLRMVPGLHITQHTGGAKAHQIFLRGFDAEHGQDVAAYLDGIPLNEPSHVHSMGYLDLHFLLPEAIQRVWVLKGPYDARFGDHATAGVINVVPYTGRDFRARVTAEGGSDWTAAGMVEGAGAWAGMQSYAAVQAERTDGFTNPGRQWAARAFLHHVVPLARAGELRLLYAGYHTGSEAADILPKAWVDQGLVSRFDALDTSNRVDVYRHLAGLTWDWQRADWTGRVQVWGNAKQTAIWSNYSFYYFDPVHGDQTEQRDERVAGGLNAHATWVAGAESMAFQTELGFQGRVDAVDQRQARTEARALVDGKNRYDFTETALGLYLDERADLTTWLALVAGLRADAILYHGSGTQDRYGVEDHTIPVVTGAELGTALTLWDRRFHLSASGWWADKEGETVFDSEVGATIPRGRSRRFGADVELRVWPTPWMSIGTDLFYVHARFVDGSVIPNQAEWMMTNVLALHHPKGVSGSLRGRFVGPRTHDLGYESDASYVVDAQLGYEWDQWEITLSVENLLGAVWYDSVFAYPSRPVQGGQVIEGLHVTPGCPTLARLRLAWRF